MTVKDHKDTAQAVIAEAEKAVAQLGGAQGARADRLSKLHELFTVVEQRYQAQQQDLAERDEHIRVLTEANEGLTSALRALTEAANRTTENLGEGDTDLLRALERSESLVARAFGTGGNANPTQSPDAPPLADVLDGSPLTDDRDADAGQDRLLDSDVDAVGGGVMEPDDPGEEAEGFEDLIEDLDMDRADDAGDPDTLVQADIDTDAGAWIGAAEEPADEDGPAFEDDEPLDTGDALDAATAEDDEPLGIGDALDAATAEDDEPLGIGDALDAATAEDDEPLGIGDALDAATAEDDGDGPAVDDQPVDDAIDAIDAADSGTAIADVDADDPDLAPTDEPDEPVIRWSEKWSVGASEMDRDHRILINLINQLPAALNKAPERGWIVGSVLNSLWDYTEYHFEREEALQKAANFPGAEDHASRHQELKAQVREWLDRYQADPDAMNGTALLAFLKGWLTNHILGEDMRYKPYVQNNPDAQAVAAAIKVDPDLIEDLGDAAIVTEPAD